MSDNRAEKLSVARKMLKEHQEKARKSKDTFANDTKLETGSVNSQSSVTAVEQCNFQSYSDVTDSPCISSSRESGNTISSFFTNNHVDSKQSVQFFDNLPVSNSNPVMNTDLGPSSVFSDSQAREEIYNNSFTSRNLSEINSRNQSDSLPALYNEALLKLKWYDNELENIKKISEDRLKNEVGRLEEQITLQRMSIEIALGEKSNLQKSLGTTQEELQTCKSTCEELTNRLKASRSLVSKLETELNLVNEAKSQHNSILKRLETSLSQQKSAADQFRVELEDARHEIRVLRKDKESIASELDSLEKKLEEKESQLSLAHIKIQQLGGEVQNTDESAPSNDLEREVSQLKAELETAVNQQVQTQQYFQDYIANLKQQLQEANTNFEKAASEKSELQARTDNLVSHIEMLERQLQPGTTQQAQAELVKKLNDQLSASGDAVRLAETELEKLKLEIAELKELSGKETKRAEAAEEELSVTKAEVDAARQEVESLKSETERIMSDVPDAKLLQAAMESDKVAATRAIQQNNQLKNQLDELQQAFVKLQDTKLDLTEQVEQQKQQILTLQEELAGYIKSEVSRDHHHNHDHHHHHESVATVDGCCQTTYHDLEVVSGGNTDTVTPEAAAMLQDKFRSTMNRLAELSEEKQKLEHLVIQLQSETDTIGEYIALYQSQRCKLEKKAIERDQLIEVISKEKEELRSKLSEVTSLIPTLLKPDNHIVIGEEVKENSHLSKLPSEANGDITSDVTVKKVMNLLSEISSSKLVTERIQTHAPDEPCPNTFHPCAVCSGRLITV